MLAHVRANLWLLALTLLLCSVAYPLALWGVGQTAFCDQANGSLVYDNDLLVGSRLIAHEVKGDEYFQPRPSATGGSPWNAMASGASNWGANNYALRDRVARALAPLAKYANGPKKGQLVAPDVVKWFRTERPLLVAEWARAHAGLAQGWAKSHDVTKQFVLDWFKRHPADRPEWQRNNPGKDSPQPEELAVAFFESFARDHPATWLTVTESKTEKDDKGAPIKRVVFVDGGAEDSADIASVFFDPWRDAHPNVELEDIPADMVMASASGLDPHITLENADYQLERVVNKWAELTRRERAKLHDEIASLVQHHKSAPMFGLAGVELINVVDVNLAMKKRYGGTRN